MEIQLVTNKKIAETSSKGNQEKWFDADTNLWYKLDLFGYEALAETVISTALKRCNVEELGFSSVLYQPEKVKVRNQIRTGCVSENFLRKGEMLITVASLLKKGIGADYLKQLEKQPTLKAKIAFLVDRVVELTGLVNFGTYLTLLFEADMLFLNEDRHLNNIAVIRGKNGFEYCPLFDFGAGLLSNIRDYPLDIEPKGLMKSVYARPFNCSFTRQVHAAQALYGQQLIPQFSIRDIYDILDEIRGFYPESLFPLFRDRVLTVIEKQSKKLK